MYYSQVESESRSVMSDSLRSHGLYSARNSPGQNTGVGSRSLFQRIFPTQGRNPGLPHCKRILHQLSHKGSPGGASGKESIGQCRRHKRCGFDPWIRKIPWRRARPPTPGFLPGETHGQRSLAGYSPWGHQVSHVTEKT